MRRKELRTVSLSEFSFFKLAIAFADQNPPGSGTFDSSELKVNLSCSFPASSQVSPDSLNNYPDFHRGSFTALFENF